MFSEFLLMRNSEVIFQEGVLSYLMTYFSPVAFENCLLVFELQYFYYMSGCEFLCMEDVLDI